MLARPASRGVFIRLAPLILLGAYVAIIVLALVTGYAGLLLSSPVGVLYYVGAYLVFAGVAIVPALLVIQALVLVVWFARTRMAAGR